MLYKKTHEMVPIPMKRDFVRQFHEALVRLGYTNRSDFIRTAIVEKLRREGVEIIEPTPAETVRRWKARQWTKTMSTVAAETPEPYQVHEQKMPAAAQKQKQSKERL